MRLVAFTFSISLPGVPESWESRSLGSLGSPGVLGVSGVPESRTVNCTFASYLDVVTIIPHTMVTIIHHTMVTIIPGHGDQHRGKGLTVRTCVFTFKKKTVLLRSSFDCITILQKRILASGSHGIFAHYYGWSGLYIGIHIEH